MIARQEEGLTVAEQQWQPVCGQEYPCLLTSAQGDFHVEVFATAEEREEACREWFDALARRTHPRPPHIGQDADPPPLKTVAKILEDGKLMVKAPDGKEWMEIAAS